MFSFSRFNVSPASAAGERLVVRRQRGRSGRAAMKNRRHRRKRTDRKKKVVKKPSSATATRCWRHHHHRVSTPSLARDWRRRLPALRWSSMSRIAPSWEDNAVLAFFRDIRSQPPWAAEAAAGPSAITWRCRSSAPTACSRVVTSAQRWLRKKPDQGFPDFLTTIVPAPTQFFEFRGRHRPRRRPKGRRFRLPLVLMQPIAVG